MNKKYTFTLISFLFVLIGCQKEQEIRLYTDYQILIENVEIASENTKKVYTDNDLHLEAMITAEAGIKQVQVQVTPQTQGVSLFAITQTFTDEIKGKKFYNLHEHYDVPRLAKVGTYDVLIIVTDVNGQKKIFEDELSVELDPISQIFADVRFVADNIEKTLTISGYVRMPENTQFKSFSIEAMRIKYEFDEITRVTGRLYQIEKTISIRDIPLPWHFDAVLTITDQNGVKYTKKRFIHQH